MIENEFNIGPGILAEAEVRGEIPERLVNSMLYEPTYITIDTKFGAQRVKFLPGHIADDKGPYGPPQGATKVMVIGKMPGRVEARTGKLMAGPSGNLFAGILEDIDMDYTQWYLTNLVKFQPPDGTKRVPVKWVKECRYILEEEIKSVAPEFLLVMGSEAVKAMFGNKATLTKYRGATALEYKGIPVIVTTLPTAVLAEPKLTNDFKKDLETLKSRVEGTFKEADPVVYEVVTDEKRLTAVVDELIAGGYKRFAVDCEWGNKDGTGGDYEKGGKLRLIQFSHRSHHGFAVEIRGEGMEGTFNPNPEAAFAQLRRLFCREGVQLGGWNIPADMKWLVGEAEVKCLPQFFAGIDGMQAYHLLFPNEMSYKLETAAARHTDMGRYDLPIENWINANTKKDNKKVYLQMYGYAFIPSEILYPYAMKDVDVVMRLWDMLEAGLQAVVLDNPYEMPGIYRGTTVSTLYDFYRCIEHPAIFPRFEIECEGLDADRERLIHLVELFEHRSNALAAELQKMLRWPDFNPRSYMQVQEMLFDKPPYRDRIRSEGAISLGLTPVKTTEKPSQDWGRVKAVDANSGKIQPATDVETVQILQTRVKDPEIKAALTKMLTFKYVDQVRKNFLRPAELNPFTGNSEWVGGMVSCIDNDGRIRTTLLALTDTGRYSSSNPNLQNLPKRREADLRKAFCPDRPKLEATRGWDGMSVKELKSLGLLDDGYFTIRSCLRAKPGHVLIEADYVQAELATLAYISNDINMKAVMDDPDRDLHSETAVAGLALPCMPAEVKKLFPSQRIVAKSINFGVSYGRGANALVRAAAAEGVQTTKDEAQALIDGFFTNYPMTRVYLDACHHSMEDRGYVANAYGRRRLFSPTNDERILAANRREAGNMPIQGTVADALNIALFNLWRYRDARKMGYRIVLAVHDAVFLEVPWNEVEEVKTKVLPLCMSEGASVPTIGLKLDIDIDVMRRWGEKTTEAEAIAEAKAETVAIN